MLRIARENVPEGLFIEADAAQFRLRSRADAAVSVFDSLNHIMDARQLTQAFACIHDALKPGACFVFDINTSAAYGERWDDSFCDVQSDHAFFLRGRFDREARVGLTEVTIFRLAGSWERSDIQIRQRPWDVEEIETMLGGAAFDDVRVFRAVEDLRMSGHYGIGRVYVSARRSTSRHFGTA
jgi:SAM-dependent methyltransferase